MRSSRLHSAHILAAFFSLFAVIFLAQSAYAQNATIQGTITGGPTPPNIAITALETDVDVPYRGEVIGTSYVIQNVPPGNYSVTAQAGPQWISVPSSVRVQVTATYGTVYGPPIQLIPAQGSISGQISFANPALCTRDLSSQQVQVYLYSVSGQTYTPLQSTSSNVPNRTGGYGTYEFSGVPPGSYLVLGTANNQNGYIYVTMGGTGGGGGSDLINQNFTLLRGLFNICGSVWQPQNGDAPAPGTVYAFVANGPVVSTTVQSDGTYIIPNLPPNDWGVFMVNNSPTWSYTPGWPNFQPVYLSDDAININFTATQALYTVSGLFLNLPSSWPMEMYLWNNATNQFVQIKSVQPIANHPWAFTNVAPGNYSVLTGPPPSYGVISPTRIAGIQVNGNISNLTFTLVNTGSGTLKGVGYSSPQPGGPSGYYSPAIRIASADYADDFTNLTVLGGNPINWYTKTSPYAFTQQLHPGKYTWTIQGEANLRVVPASGSFPITANATFNMGSIVFFKSGAGVSFVQNNCNSAVCSSEPPSGTAEIAKGDGVKLFGLLSPTGSSGSSEGATPRPQDTVCITSPVAAAARPELPGGAGGFIERQATAPAGSCGPTATSTPVDITQVDTIDFNGGFGPPDPNNPGSNLPDATVPASNTTVQFSGVLYAATDGWYQFQTTTNGPVTLTVNNTSLVNSWIDTEQTQAGQVYLNGGHQYVFNMSYAYDSVSTAAVNLAWQQPTDNTLNTTPSLYFAENSTLTPLQDWVLSGNGQTDNYTTNNPDGQQAAAASGYAVARIEGCAYQYQLPNTVPLNVYYNGVDYFTTSTDLTQQPGGSGSYSFIGNGGYVFPTPLTDGSSIPLQTWSGNNDNYAAASPAGINAAQQAGYIFLQTEGYVLPATSCQ